jgi:hypothetical protein
VEMVRFEAKSHPKRGDDKGNETTG